MKTGSARNPRARRCTGATVAAVVLCLGLSACSPRGYDPTIRNILEKDLGETTLQTATEEIDRNYAEPRVDYRVEHSFRAALDSISPVNEYESLWRAVRACAWLGFHHPLPSKRREFALEGVAYGLAATKKMSRRVEPYYYTGLCHVALAETRDVPTEEDIKKIKYHLEVAKEIDAGFDHCGPLRVLGSIYEKTTRDSYTGPRLGNLLPAVDLLERACDGCPDFGANQLTLARVLTRVGEYSRARVALERVLRADVPLDYSVEHRKWLHDAQTVREQVALLDNRSVEATAYHSEPTGLDDAETSSGTDDAAGSVPAVEPPPPIGIEGINSDGSVEPAAFRRDTEE